MKQYLTNTIVKHKNEYIDKILFIEKGIIFSGLKLPTDFSVIETALPQYAQVVAIVLLDVTNSAPQWLH